MVPKFPAPFPVDEDKARVFIEFYRLGHKNTTFGYLRNFVSSFSFDCKERCVENFTRSTTFNTYMLGLKRTMLGDSSPNAKAPLTPSILIGLSLSIDDNSIEDVEFMTIVSMCFYGFLRINECLSLAPNEVYYDEDGRMIISVKMSKTDQTGRRVNVYVNQTYTFYSPFIWLEKYLKLCKPVNQRLFTFSDNLFRIKLKNMLSSMGVDPNSYSSHSLRKGAASTAAQLGIQDCQIKAQGRWLSECYQRYTAVTMQQAVQHITTRI